MSIEKNFNKFLFDIVKSKSMDNRVAKTIVTNYQRLNRDSKEKFFETLMSSYTNFSESAFDSIKFEEKFSADLEEDLKDFRIKAVRLANVRGIPGPKQNTKYGFDLFEDSQIQNAVFLGSNGTGKSSLFSAIEFIYANEVAERKLRIKNPESLKETDFLKYLEHFNEAPECEIVTPSGKYSLRNRVFKSIDVLRSIYPDSHFISDFDIYSKGQINYLGDNNDLESFHNLIASSLGLKDYLDFTSLLKSVSSYRRTKESNDRNKLITDKNNLTEENQKNQEQINLKTEKIKELKSRGSDDPTSDARERLSKVILSLKELSYPELLAYSDYKNIFNSYINAYSNYVGLSVNQNLQIEAQFLTLGLELINQSENCPLCGNSNLSVPDIKKKIEKRIREIKEFDSASKVLEVSITNLRNYIKELLTIIQSIERTLKLEFDRTTAVQEFIEINRNGKEIIDRFLNIIKDFTDLDEAISKIFSASDILSRRNDEIYKIITDKESGVFLDLDNLNDVLKKYYILRQKKLIEVESKINIEQNAVTPKQQIIVLESEIKNHQSIINHNGQQIKAIERETERLTQTINTIAEIKSKTGEFATVLEIAVNRIVGNSFEPIKETITEILSEYLREDNVTLQIRLDEHKSNEDPEAVITTILAEIQRINNETGEIEIHSPSKYFNTFRYRLFCTMVSISVVIAARKNTGINIPLVLDDVFYASDYNSKITFNEFITKILNIFQKFNSNMPLQLILFTHDELVFDSAIEAFAEFEFQNESSIETENKHLENHLQSRTIFARLFSAKEIDASITESSFGNYWDLTYKIPTRLEQILK